MCTVCVLLVVVSFIVYCTYVIVFCFKQKTAYEMRISDWSSDVCSSDLRGMLLGTSVMTLFAGTTAFAQDETGAEPQQTGTQSADNDIIVTGRSEEHTSELQSLMRISYAVFCLKKKKKQK